MKSQNWFQICVPRIFGAYRSIPNYFRARFAVVWSQIRAKIRSLALFSCSRVESSSRDRLNFGSQQENRPSAGEKSKQANFKTQNGWNLTLGQKKLGKCRKPTLPQSHRRIYSIRLNFEYQRFLITENWLLDWTCWAGSPEGHCERCSEAFQRISIGHIPLVFILGK